jgi:hypothetical protein
MVTLSPGVIASCAGYSVLWPELEAELVTQVGPLLRQKMLRGRENQPDFPMKVRLSVWPHLNKLLSHRYDGQVLLDSDDKIASFLTTDKETYQRKTFVQGSYAVVTAPLTLRFDLERNEIVILLNYAVYNDAGTLQWPLSFW